MLINKFNYALPETLVETFRRNVSMSFREMSIILNTFNGSPRLFPRHKSAASLREEWRSGTMSLGTGEKALPFSLKLAWGLKRANNNPVSPVPNP